MYQIQSMDLVCPRDTASQKDQENTFKRFMVQSKLRTACTLHLVSCIASSRFTFITPNPYMHNGIVDSPKPLLVGVRMCILPACTPGHLSLRSAIEECLWLTSD